MHKSNKKEKPRKESVKTAPVALGSILKQIGKDTNKKPPDKKKE